MKKKLIAASLLLALGTFVGVKQMVAADSAPPDLKIKQIEGWRAHETNDFKIDKVNDTFVVEGLNADNHHGTTFIRWMTPEDSTRRFLLSADIRTENLTGWAGLWMRIDGPDKKPLAFDNMENRPITGTQAWKPYKVVLDVSPKAKSIVFGFLISGKGKAWVKNIRFTPVDSQENSTDILNRSLQADKLNQEPQNLEMK